MVFHVLECVKASRKGDYFTHIIYGIFENNRKILICKDIDSIVPCRNSMGTINNGYLITFMDSMKTNKNFLI